MRESFAKNLGHYSELAKEQMRDDMTEEEIKNLEGAFQFRIRKAAEVRGTSDEVQIEVFKLQQFKQEIMKQMKIDIANLDDPEFEPKRKEGDRRIVCENGKYFWRGAKEGKPNIEVTLGDIMTDGEWGILYFLDPTSVPKNVRKKYLVESAKMDLRKFLDWQIVWDETGSQQTPSGVKNSYYKSVDEKESLRSGVLAEKIVRNIFAKLVLDFDIGLEISESDVYQDVEKKVDFILRRKKHYRGVEIKEDESVLDIGVQLTLHDEKKVLHFKNEQIAQAREKISKGEDKILDIILVSVPAGFNFSGLYEEFKKNPWCGGPEKYLPIEIKKKFVRKILQGMVSEHELEEIESKIK